MRNAQETRVTWLRAVVVLLALSACGGGPLSFLTGGGPNVAANVQAGAENRQAGVSVEGPTQSLVRPQARTIRQEQNATRAETIQTVQNNPPLWVWLLLILGWLLPSPGEMGRTVGGWFRR